MIQAFERHRDDDVYENSGTGWLLLRCPDSLKKGYVTAGRPQRLCQLPEPRARCQAVVKTNCAELVTEIPRGHCCDDVIIQKEYTINRFPNKTKYN